MLFLLKRFWATALFCVLALAIFGWVSWEAWRLRMITWETGTDYWEHSATLHALIENPWHPWHPHLATHDGSPRFGPQFLLVALVARLLHLGALDAMSLAASFNIALFLSGIYTFYRAFFRVTLAPLYGLLVMFGAWWVGFHFSNVYSMAQIFSTSTFPSTTALGLTLHGFALTTWLLRGGQRRFYAWLALLGVWAAAVFIVHPLTAVMSISGCLLLSVTEPCLSWRRRAEVFGAVLVGCALSHFWPYFSPWVVVRGGHGEAADWASESMKQAAAQIQVKPRLHNFYNPPRLMRTLGLGLLTIVALPWFLLRRRRWFVAVGALSMLVPFAVNAYIELPLGHRFVLLAVVYLHIGVVWLLLCLTPGHALSFRFLRFRYPLLAIPSTLLVVSTLAVFCNHAVVDARNPQKNPRYAARPVSPVIGNNAVLADLAGPNAVVLANPLLSWPLPTFGPKVLVLHHMDPLVRDASQREADVQRFLRFPLSDADREAIIRKYGVTHVLLQRESGAVSRYLDKNATLHTHGSFRLYSLPRQKP